MSGNSRSNTDDRTARFSGEKNSQVTYEKAKAAREKERVLAVKNGLIPDPNRRRRLEDASNLIGTCSEMCPEFERVEREFQHAVDKWELDPATGRIDPSRAVKTFHRPAAGDETPLPSDVRPPHILKTTLHYLIRDLLTNNSIDTTHHFIRDRTRSIRQDFTLQHDSGSIAIECHERIARLHILTLHEMRGVKDYTEHLEMEQLRKVLQSLIEFYDDAHRDGISPPNEAEFRAYHILAHIRDPDVAHQLEKQADRVLDAPIVQTALDIRAVAQRNNMAKSRRSANTEAAQNHFSRFFSLVTRPSTPFLLACLLEAHFTDVRKGALKALKNSILEALKPFPVHAVTEMLGFNDDDDTAAFASALSLPVIADPESGAPLAIKLNKKSIINENAVIPPSKSTRLVSSKRAGRSHAEYVDGLVSTTVDTPVVPPSPVTRAAALFPHRRLSSARSVTPTFSPGPLSPFRVALPSDLHSSESSASSPTPVITKPSPAPQFGSSVFGKSSFFGPQPSQPTSSQTPLPSASSNLNPFVWKGLSTSSTALIPRSKAPEVSLPESRPNTVQPPFQSPAPSKDSDTPVVAPPTQQTYPSQIPESKTTVTSSRITRRSSTLRPSSPPLDAFPSPKSQLSGSPKSSNPQAAPPQNGKEGSVLLRRPREIDALTASTFSLMANAWIALQCRDAAADAQRNRRLLQRFVRHWVDRVIDRMKTQKAAAEGRAELRRAIRRASWSLADDDATLTASRASSVTVDYHRSRRPIEDDEYVKSLESASALRATLWARGSFLASIRRRLLLLHSGTLPPRWNIWLCTASESPNDSTAQWLRRKLDMDDSNITSLQNSGRTCRRLVDADGPSRYSSDASLDVPGLIVFEVSRDFNADEPDSLHQWQAEFKRLKNLLVSIPKDSGYAPVAILVFWVPDDRPSSELRSRIAEVINASLLKAASVRMLLLDIEIVLLSSAAAADASFATAIESADFDVQGNIPGSTSLADALRPYALAWNRCLSRGMQKVSPGGNSICSRNFALLFSSMSQALNTVVLHAWRWVTNRNPNAPDLPIQLPAFEADELNTLPQLHAALAGYFSLPLFSDSPVAESFKAELRNASNFRSDVLLSSILKRLADAVIFDLIVACERMTDILEPSDASMQLTLYEKQLEHAINRLPRFEPDPLTEDTVNGESTDTNRKRVASEEISRHEDKRIRATPERGPSSGREIINGPKQGSTSAASLLKAVREARAKHALSPLKINEVPR